MVFQRDDGTHSLQSQAITFHYLLYHFLPQSENMIAGSWPTWCLAFDDDVQIAHEHRTLHTELD